jgi:hypothetical protein
MCHLSILPFLAALPHLSCCTNCFIQWIIFNNTNTVCPHCWCYEFSECDGSSHQGITSVWAQVVTFLICIQEVPSLNLSQDTNYPDRLSWFSSVPPDKSWDMLLIRPWLLPSTALKFIIHCSPVIWCYRIWVTDSIIKYNTIGKDSHMTYLCVISLHSHGHHVILFTEMSQPFTEHSNCLQ